MKRNKKQPRPYNKSFFQKALLLLVLGALVLMGHIFYASSQASLWEQGGQITDLVWGVTTLIDLYLGLAIFAVWTLYREKSFVIAGIWTLVYMGTGFFGVAVYLISQLIALLLVHGDILRFFMGKQNAEKLLRVRE